MHTVSLALFKELIFDTKKGDIAQTIQVIIDRERNGEAVDRALLRSVIELFVVMGACINKIDFKSMKAAIAYSKRKVTTS